jgi:hypothetical protein
VKKLIITLTLLATLYGCKTTNSIYYWGNYASTSYDYKHEPSQETREKHLAEIEKILATAETKNKLIPPGLYIEIAMLHAEQGDLTNAKANLDKELALYPESKEFIDLLNQRMSAG